jgi:hypothetical protein
MKSESETKWVSLLSETNERFNNNERIQENEYEVESDEMNDIEMVRGLE